MTPGEYLAAVLLVVGSIFFLAGTLGLLCSRHERGERAIELCYAGLVELGAVLRLYVEGAGAADFKQEVLAASRDGERHRFMNERESFEMMFWHRPGGEVELGVKKIQQ